LARDWLLNQFGTTRDEAIPAYYRLIAAGMGEASPLARTCHNPILCRFAERLSATGMAKKTVIGQSCTN
jgi:hypothetical protein